MFKAYPRQRLELSRKELLSCMRVIASGGMFRGNGADIFEKEFSGYIGVKHATAVYSGRSALFLALKSMGYGKWDEVILPAYTFYVVPMVVSALGLRPVFVDANPHTFNMDVSRLKEAVTDRTRCIIATHLLGQPCEIEAVLKFAQKYNLDVIEDCAEACGAEYRGKKVGSFGKIGCFSFQSGKSLTCLGGGALVTNDAEINARIRGELLPEGSEYKEAAVKNIVRGMLMYMFTRNIFFSFFAWPLIIFSHLLKENFVDDFFDEKIPTSLAALTFNRWKMCNLQAVIGIEQLARADSLNEMRILNSETLLKEIGNCKNILLPTGINDIKHIYHWFYLSVDKPMILRKRLIAKGVDTRRDVLSCCPGYKIFGTSPEGFPVARRLSAQNILVPNYPSLSKTDMLRIAKAIRACLADLPSSRQVDAREE